MYPAEQLEQKARPVVGANWPAGHSEQPVAPEALLAWPIAQDAHTLCEVWSV